MSLAYVYSPRALNFHPPPPTLEVAGTSIELGPMGISNPLLTELAHELAERSGMLEGVLRIEPAPAPDEVLTAVHADAYVDELRAASLDGGPWEGEFAPVTDRTWDAACLTAGGAVAAVDSVMSGTSDRALVQMRPPGHHAERARAMGSCYLNNVACAAERALERGAERVMIVDWDVHIGNGAEKIFWDRSDVLALSIHQRGWFPEGAGHRCARGGAAAEGFTVNVPLPPATTDAGYLLTLERIVGPIAHQFRPDLIVLASGFDPAIFDPMGRMMVSSLGFGALAEWLAAIAEEASEGRLVACVEGGYSHSYTPLCALALLGGMRGRLAAVEDPFEGEPETLQSRRAPSAELHEALTAVVAAQPRWFIGRGVRS